MACSRGTTVPPHRRRRCAGPPGSRSKLDQPLHVLRAWGMLNAPTPPTKQGGYIPPLADWEAGRTRRAGRPGERARARLRAASCTSPTPSRPRRCSMPRRGPSCSSSRGAAPAGSAASGSAPPPTRWRGTRPARSSSCRWVAPAGDPVRSRPTASRAPGSGSSGDRPERRRSPAARTWPSSSTCSRSPRPSPWRSVAASPSTPFGGATNGRPSSRVSSDANLALQRQDARMRPGSVSLSPESLQRATGIERLVLPVPQRLDDLRRPRRAGAPRWSPGASATPRRWPTYLADELAAGATVAVVAGRRALAGRLAAARRRGPVGRRCGAGRPRPRADQSPEAELAAAAYERFRDRRPSTCSRARAAASWSAGLRARRRDRRPAAPRRHRGGAAARGRCLHRPP